jgi:glycosyltransferase involved in cell wall biosynthesis
MLPKRIAIYVVANCKAELYGSLKNLRDTGYPFSYLVVLASFPCPEFAELFKDEKSVFFRKTSFLVSTKIFEDPRPRGPILLVYQSDILNWGALFAAILKEPEEDLMCFSSMNACYFRKLPWAKNQSHYFVQPRDLFRKNLSREALLDLGRTFADQILAKNGEDFIRSFSSHALSSIARHSQRNYFYKWRFLAHTLNLASQSFGKKTLLKTIYTSCLLVLRDCLGHVSFKNGLFKDISVALPRIISLDQNRLVIFLHRMSLDGATNIVLRILQQSPFQGSFQKITLVSPFAGSLVDSFQKLNVDIKIINYSRAKWGMSCSVQQKIESILAEHDFLWINTIHHPAPMIDLIRRSQKKTFLFGHESLRAGSPVLKDIGFSSEHKMAFKDLLDNANNTAAFCSTSTVRYAMEAFQSKKIEIIPGTFSRPPKPDLDRYHAIERIDFLVTGWVGERKNQASVVPVFKHLANLHSHAPGLRDFTLTFVGTPYEIPAYQALIQDALRHLPAEKLCFFPMVNHALMVRLLQRYHVTLIPSLGEALCLTAMEMMSTGGIVVHSDCEGSEDLIEHGRTGFVFKKDNPDSLLKLLLDILDPAMMRKDDFFRIGEASYQKTSMFTETRVSELIMRAILGDSRKSPLEIQHQGHHSK